MREKYIPRFIQGEMPSHSSSCTLCKGTLRGKGGWETSPETFVKYFPLTFCSIKCAKKYAKKMKTIFHILFKITSDKYGNCFVDYKKKYHLGE